MGNELEALIFDFDGLMIDSERVEAECIKEIVADWGHSLEYTDIGHLFGTVDADEEWEELLQRTCGRTVGELEAQLRRVRSSRKDELPLLPGVEELLDLAQQRGLRVGLATGSTRATLERRLGRHGVFDRFDAVVTRAEVDRGKPSPDIYFEVAQRLGVATHACLVLEDSVPGCEAALAAGMRVIACPSVVTAHLAYPPDVRRVRSLVDIAVNGDAFTF